MTDPLPGSEGSKAEDPGKTTIDPGLADQVKTANELAAEEAAEEANKNKTPEQIAEEKAAKDAAEAAAAETGGYDTSKVFEGDETIDQERLARSMKIAGPKLKEFGYTQEQVEQLLPIQAEIMKAEIAREVEALTANADEVVTKREARLKEILEAPADKQGGGYSNWDPASTDHPAKLDMVKGIMALSPGEHAEKVQYAREVIQGLDESGATTIIMPLLARLGRLSAEDGFKLGDAGRRPKTRAEAMYPDQRA